MVGYKQVLVLRRDLGMGAGKAAVQAAHASVEALFLILDSSNRRWRLWLSEWRLSGQKKVALRVNSFSELVSIYNKCKSKGLPCSIIRDAGLTQLPPGTATAVAVGPGPEEIVNEITGELKLY
ncbi:MAG: peptidyl-tRNA hydrolase Pth2 [Desulfurococcales archaeon]|nr:peptidyl-tRNA hydrolase Pth2 [Desulfurococcales archaeon]